ncbi:uncharacterized protein NPIL_494211 [Nephila pilipes]|uniref:MD-2-related lipid-recognition domain-containing protein n=1 Tax=Nephila pilipes TaxID=299642 RepID=A0A8X6TQZ2_NEPPI|nr:uncharacterized protein NPIL_494211 [Nephila pilipes]
MKSVFYLLCIGLLVPSLVNGGATFSDCGDANKKLVMKDGSVKPDPIHYPGNLTMNVSMVVLKDLPAANFQMKMSLMKLEPRRMKVPCLQDIGSCTYDVCDMIKNHKDTFCPMFPDPKDCGCPMKANSYFMKNAFVPIPDFGEIFAKILQGGYEGNITFIDGSTNTEVGCVAMTFQIVPK